ncbi:unnamed protein product [Calypogeia fissa]
MSFITPDLWVFLIVNSVVLGQLHQVDVIVYGMGSLYTSICPSLVLRGVGETIAKRKCPKVCTVVEESETIAITAD